MNETKSFAFNRRSFLGKAVPGCLFACVARNFIFGSGTQGKGTGPHKFEKPYKGSLSCKEYYYLKYEEYVKVLNSLSRQLGRQKLIEILKSATDKDMLEYGKKHARRSSDNSLQSYISFYKNPAEDRVITKKIQKDTDKVFEIEVTECIWAYVFRKLNAGDFGFAAICYGDYAWAKGFNPKIEMIRDKTLMEGHNCCNHRYILKT